jgi:hypothetical protein
MGIVPIYCDDMAIPIANSGTWFRLRVSTRKPNTSELNRRVFARIETLKGKAKKSKVDYVKMPQAEFAKIQDEVKAELTKETPPGHKDIDVMFMGDWFVVASSSARDCDLVTKFLLDKLGADFSVCVATMAGDEPLSEIGRGVLEAEGLKVDNIELKQQIKATLHDGTAISVGKADYSTDLLAVLQNASTVHSMSVLWGGEFTATVNSDFSFTAIKFDLDVDEIEGDDDDHTGHLQDRERAKTFARSMPLFLKDLGTHHKGLAELPKHDEQKPIDFEKAKLERKGVTS